MSTPYSFKDFGLLISDDYLDEFCKMTKTDFDATYEDQESRQCWEAWPDKPNLFCDNGFYGINQEKYDEYGHIYLTEHDGWRNKGYVLPVKRGIVIPLVEDKKIEKLEPYNIDSLFYDDRHKNIGIRKYMPLINHIFKQLGIKKPDTDYIKTHIGLIECVKYH